MKIVQINSVNNSSTGSIMMNIHNELLKKGYESYVVWGRGRKSNNDKEIYMNDMLGVYKHAFLSRLTGMTGFFSKKSTRELIKKLEKIKPDIIHLHSLHGYYINIELLFEYIKKNNIQTVWTFHDCWAFTGHCAYFTYAQCDKWKTGCYRCPQKKKFPKAYVDCSKYCFNRKKEIFTSINKLTIVTPSKWLSTMVKKSFLKKYDTIVINNGIDVNTFNVLNKEKLSFRKKYKLESKIILLGIAAQFSEEKGYLDYLRLSKLLDDKYLLVLVGLNKKQLKDLPNNIIGIERTENVKELVDIYNSSDLLINFTYEDNYPTVNLEAIACGTPVLTYDTGGSVECLDFLKNIKKDKFIIEKEYCKNDMNYVKNMIDNIINQNIVFDNPEKYSKKSMIEKYINLYELLLDNQIKNRN